MGWGGAPLWEQAVGHRDPAENRCQLGFVSAPTCSAAHSAWRARRLGSALLSDSLTAQPK